MCAPASQVYTFLFAVAGVFLYSEQAGFRIDRRKAAAEKSYDGGRGCCYVRRFDFYSTPKAMETLILGATANTWFTWADRLNEDGSATHGAVSCRATQGCFKCTST